MIQGACMACEQSIPKYCGISLTIETQGRTKIITLDSECYRAILDEARVADGRSATLRRLVGQ